VDALRKLKRVKNIWLIWPTKRAVTESAREWMRQNISGKEAEEIAVHSAVSADNFI
jgi:hypothetical protein